MGLGTTENTPEHARLEDARTGKAPWKAWGPYLSERQWGTVREVGRASCRERVYGTV